MTPEKIAACTDEYDYRTVWHRRILYKADGTPYSTTLETSGVLVYYGARTLHGGTVMLFAGNNPSDRLIDAIPFTEIIGIA